MWLSMSDDWYRNTAWNESIAREFEEKLARARRKEQYLRIQASTLAHTHPETALALLERYFELPDDFDHTQAHVDRAYAWISLGSLDKAIACYEAALAREAEFPKLQTQAYLDLPYLIATRDIESMFERASQLLDQFKSRLMFPVDYFKWHAAKALIASRQQNEDSTHLHAEEALRVAAETTSGFRYHPRAGLVSTKYDSTLSKLQQLRGAT